LHEIYWIKVGLKYYEIGPRTDISPWYDN